MDHVSAFGVAAFLGQTDAVGRSVLAILLCMSVITWYLTITKTLQALFSRARAKRFLETFWDAPSLQAVSASLEQDLPRDPFSLLTHRALRAAQQHQGADPEFLTRAMRRALDEETAHVESGLTVLASVGSTAPFVGLFGTVWGVYHALVHIGMTGQGTLDKVAGPVGEALIMTAAGLAVAVPAVLAYNAFTRRNRLLLARLDSFAHDLFALLVTGAHARPQPAAAQRAA